MLIINLLIVFWFYVAQSDKYVIRIFVEHTKFRPAYTQRIQTENHIFR